MSEVSLLELALSIIMSFGTILIAVNIWLIIRQNARHINIKTIDNIEKIARTLIDFHQKTANIPEYTAESEQFYIQHVEPYLDFLLWVYFHIEKKLFKISIIRTYNDYIRENYNRIKQYIAYQREGDIHAWEEIDKLMKKLHIDP